MAAASAGGSCNFAKFCKNFPCDGSELTPLYQCEKDTNNHCSLLQCSEKIPGKPFSFYNIPEALLILYRSGVFSVDRTTLELSICRAHRDFLGVNWRRGKVRCSFPEHNENSKAKADRGATPSFCKEYWLQTRQAILVGSG